MAARSGGRRRCRRARPPIPDRPRKPPPTAHARPAGPAAAGTSPAPPAPLSPATPPRPHRRRRTTAPPPAPPHPASAPRHSQPTRPHQQPRAPIGQSLEIAIHLVLARLDQRQQVPRRDHPLRDRRRQRSRHLVPLRLPLHNFTPPLQPDQRQRRLARHLPRPRQLMVERIHRQQRIPPLRRRKQRGQESVRVMAANQSSDRVVHARVVARSNRRRNPGPRACPWATVRLARGLTPRRAGHS